MLDKSRLLMYAIVARGKRPFMKRFSLAVPLVVVAALAIGLTQVAGNPSLLEVPAGWIIPDDPSIPPHPTPPPKNDPPGVNEPTPPPSNDPVAMRRTALEGVDESAKLAITSDLIAVVLPGIMPEDVNKPFDPTKAVVAVHDVVAGSILVVHVGGKTEVQSITGGAPNQERLKSVLQDRELMQRFEDVLARGRTAHSLIEWDKLVAGALNAP